MLHSYDKQIIHIQYENECILTSYNIVEVRILPHSSQTPSEEIKCLSLNTKLLELASDHKVPFSENTHGAPSRTPQTLWLFYVHLLLYKDIQKSSLYIHLMYPPTHIYCNVNNALDISVSHNCGERLIIVGSRGLFERILSPQIGPCVSLCFYMQHTWSYTTSWKSQLTSPLGLNTTSHTSLHMMGFLLLLHGLLPNMLVKCLCKCHGLSICDVCHHSQVRSKPL
jgi:hypothetical protein